MKPYMWIFALGCVRRPIEELPIVAPPDPAEPEVEVEVVAPAWSVVGLPGLDLRMQVAAVAASGASPATLFFSGNNEDPEFVAMGLPVTLLIPGVLPPGEHGILDVWDGVSGYTGTISDTDIQAAGDVDDDGQQDAWLGDELFLGPLLGRELQYRGNPHAWMEEEGGARAAGFDADQDGHEDVMMVQCCQTGVIHYGPFAGRIPSLLLEEADPAQVSTLGDFTGCGSSLEVAVLDDYLGPGHSAIAIGTDGAQDCNVDTTIYDLRQPRGVVRSTDDRISWASFGGSSPMELDDVGDLDGDQSHEVVYGDRFSTLVLKGPLVDVVADTPIAFEQDYPNRVVCGVGDLDGDGIEELMGIWEREHHDDLWVVSFSPHADPIDVSSGLPIAVYKDVTDDFGRLTADLDGDGLRDIIGKRIATDNDSPEPPPELIYAGEVMVWYAKDLVAAERARHSKR